LTALANGIIERRIKLDRGEAALISASDVLRATSRREPPSLRAGAAADEPETATERLTVLIVEDDAIIGWTLQALLEEMGHEVVDVAPTGERALALAAEFEPDLVLMDINLGAGMSGIEAAQALRRSHAADIVFVSAYGDPDMRSKVSREVPGAPLVGKPVAADRLEQAIRQVRRRTQ
jgi:CheY-like chemotaxis protein